jgi:hypothetical protein
MATLYERLGGKESITAVVDDFVARWVTVEMRNIDWQTRTYDLYVDCTRVTEAIHLPEGRGERVDLLDLYNYASTPNANTVAWVDDILIK